MQPDTVIASSAIPQTWNRYSYAHNNPVRFTDPTGNWIETAFDIAMIAVDVADIAKSGLNVANGAALVLDVAAVILPGIPAVGGLAIKAAKAANAVDNALDVVKIANKVDNLADTAKATENLADAAKTCLPMNSFRADTDVETSDGLQDIAGVQIGDYVLAWNEADGTLGYYEVTDAFHHTDEVVTEVILDGEWIETTPEHPFYVEGEGWTNAEDLQIGDEVHQADGTTGTVWIQFNYYKTQEMYNLTVDTAHTFFVGEGQWLVHNACEELANIAHEALGNLPKDLRQTTIAAAFDETGSPILAAFNRTPKGTEDVVKELRDQGYNVLDAPKTHTADFHAERQLYDYGRYTDIGISRQGGMCNYCQQFFDARPNVRVVPYKPY